MSALAVQAQLVRLARVLNVDPGALEFLQGHDAQALSRFRQQVSTALFDEHRSLFAKLAQANRMLPLPVTAKLTRAVIGPTIAGRVASEMAPERAVALAQRLPTDFLADTCQAMDPERASAVVRAMPTDIVAAVSQALCRNGEHITAATFVGVLDDAVIEAVMAQTPDDADLLRIGFFIEDKSRLEAVTRLMSDDRVVGCLRTAHQQGLWAEALALMDGTSIAARARLGELAAAEDDAVLRGLLDAAGQHGQWPLLLAALPELSESARKRFVDLGPDWTPEALDAVRDAIAQQGGDPDAVRQILEAA